MTRYARAKGSKASNERLPDEATPWYVMKQQLLENTDGNQQAKGKTKSAKDLLEEREEFYPPISNKNVNSSWAEFEEVNSSPKKKTAQSEDKKSQPSITNHQNDDNLKNTQEEASIKNSTNSARKNKKRKTSKDDIGETSLGNNNEPKKTKHKKPKIDNSNADTVNSNDDIVENNSKSTDDINKDIQSDRQMLSKRQKRNRKKYNEDPDKNKMPNQPSDTKEPYKFENRKHFPKNTQHFNNKKFNHCKPPKIRDDKEHKRRKPDLGAIKMVINGVDVEVVKYDGFPVKKEDAERLRELKKQMIMKGIPKSEVDAAMKLERRKAEKALARLRKSVCFHCRKAGHNLSDCPELSAEQSGTGICFKCGSTEHTHFQCKVRKTAEYRYATCFICREQGHIAQQCPDNPKGVYPDGGSCRICNSVTHLKKDCPDLVKEKETTTIRIDKITDDTLEALENTSKDSKTVDDTKKEKIVKF